MTHRSDKKEGLLLAVDLGTQSTRALCSDLSGKTVLVLRELSAPYRSAHAGRAEIPAGQYQADCFRILRRMAEALGPRVKELLGLTITANRDAILAVDKQGQPLQDWIVWADRRQTPEAMQWLHKELPLIYPLLRFFSRDFFDLVVLDSRFNWMRQHRPKLHKECFQYLSITGQLCHALTGVFADAAGMQVGVLPLNAAKHRWYRLGIIYKLLGLRKSQMPPLKQAGEILGTLTAEAAQATGLPAGLPLYASSGDKQCESLGSGAIDEASAAISYGTMACLSLTVPRFLSDRRKRFHTFPAALAKRWNMEFQLYRGYWLVTWFCQQYAKEQKLPAFLEQMNEAAALVPPGARGLFVYPFWTAHRALYPLAQGAIMGWADHHGPAELYRAILESVAFGLRQGLELFEQRSGKPIKRLYVSGGGSQSKVAMQLTADIFNRPAIRISTKEVCAQGAIMAVAYGAGMVGDLERLREAFQSEEEVFHPIPEHVARYEAIYQKIYRPFYQKNKAFFKRLGAMQEG